MQHNQRNQLLFGCELQRLCGCLQAMALCGDHPPLCRLLKQQCVSPGPKRGPTVHQRQFSQPHRPQAQGSCAEQVAQFYDRRSDPPGPLQGDLTVPRHLLQLGEALSRRSRVQLPPGCAAQFCLRPARFEQRDHLQLSGGSV